MQEHDLLAAAASLPAGWLEPHRKAGAERFSAAGLPTTKLEDWKYTNVAAVGKRAWQLGGDVKIDEATIASLGLTAYTPYRVVVANGKVIPALTQLPAGVTGGSLATVAEADAPVVRARLGTAASVDSNAFTALNTAYLADGAYLRVARSAVVREPIQLLVVTSGEGVASHPRLLVIAEGNSEVTIVEQHVAKDNAAAFVNSVTEIFAGENARVRHYRLEQLPASVLFVSRVAYDSARDSNVRSLSVSWGASLSRHDVESTLADLGAEVSMEGLYVAGGDRHVDFHTCITHAKPHCTSRELFKGILGGHATAVFNGKVVVPPDAQKTDSEQQNQNLLLSRDATVDTKPELEIYANDVKCAHGATVGQLDDAALFYLRARGIGKEDARAILTAAFARDVIEKVEPAALRERLETMLPGWLASEAR